MSQAKLHNEMQLLDLARHLRQERLLIASERQNLQTLNQKVGEALEKLHQLAWVASQQRINLDGLILSRVEASPARACRVANALEDVRFIEGYKRLGFHESLFGEFLHRLRHDAPLLAACLAAGEKLQPHALPDVVSVVTSGLYANFLLGDDEKLCLQLLKRLMELQLVPCDNPRRLLRHGSCAFSRLYKAFTEGLFSAKVFLTAALHDPILYLLMEDEMYLDVDPERAVSHYPAFEREKRFGVEGTPHYDQQVRKHREQVVDRLFHLTQRFVSGLAASVACFPSSVAWLVRQMRSLLTHSMRMEAREVHAICVDLVFAFFICPAIVNPDPCGIIEAPISPVARANLIQVAQILQVLVHSKWEPFDTKMADLYSRFDKDCVSSILDAILDEGSSTVASTGAGVEPVAAATAATAAASAAAVAGTVEAAGPAAGVGPSWTVEPLVDTHRLLQGLNRTVVLVTETELQVFVTFLRTVTGSDSLEANSKAALSGLMEPLPQYAAPVKAAAEPVEADARNGDSTASPQPATGAKNLLSKVNRSIRTRSSEEGSDSGVGTPRGHASMFNGSGGGSGCDDSPVSPPGMEQVLVIPFSSKGQECIGMLTEQQVLLSVQNKCAGVELVGSSHAESAEELHPAGSPHHMTSHGGVAGVIQEKRTRFSLSHDDGSIGNTSDNLEAVSEAASNHSVASSVDSEDEDGVDGQDPIDNLSDMVSANVSGRGSPNVSGRDTPSSQVTEGDEGATGGRGSSGGGGGGGGQDDDRRPILLASAPPKPSDIDDRFGRFDVKDMILGDETHSLVSDSWSTDVLGSDSELLNDAAERDRQSDRPPLEDVVLPGRHLLIEGEAGLFDISETASEAWSTDVITSDTERMAEVDTDETSSVARSDADADSGEPETAAAAASNPAFSGASVNPAFSGASVNPALGAIQRIRGRMSGAGSGLFRPVREVVVNAVDGSSQQQQQQQLRPPAALSLPVARPAPLARPQLPAASSSSSVAADGASSASSSSSSSSSCSSRGSVSSSTKASGVSANSSAALPAVSGSPADRPTPSALLATPASSSSGGAIPKSISFDKSADRGDKEAQLDGDEAKHKRGFFRNFKLPFKRGSRSSSSSGGGGGMGFGVAKDGASSSSLAASRPSSGVDQLDMSYSRLRRSASEESRALESSDEILAKYRPKVETSVTAPGSSMVALTLGGHGATCSDEDEDERQVIDPGNVESSYAFADAKRKLRLVLSTADVQSLHVRNSAAAAAATAASDAEHELIVFLRLQLAEAINLQDRSLVAQLHETLRCVRLFDAVGCAKLFRSLQVDYRGRKPYLSYLIQCRQSLLSVLAHLERLANRVEQDKAVCHRFLIAVCVRLFLERRDQLLVDFVDEFQHLVAADEKADWLESFLQRLSQQLERDPVWQSASPYQVQLALTAVEQRLMALIYNYALYPNADGDVSRDQVLHQHMSKLGAVVTPWHKDLRIPRIYRYECPWPSAQAELVSISAYKTPRDKVACVIRCATTIMNLLSLAAAAAERGIPAADDFMPVFVFVIIKANPPCLLSTLEYVNSFYGKRLQGEDQYWWTQFCSAIEFIKTMDYGP